MIPPGVDLTHLQGVSAPILSQACYPLPAAGHPLLNPRSGTPLQLAMMQQQLQRSGSVRLQELRHLKAYMILSEGIDMASCLRRVGQTKVENISLAGSLESAGCKILANCLIR